MSARIVHRDDRAGVTWYTIRFFDGVSESLHVKRYSDCRRFDLVLRNSLVLSKVLPPLPSPGILGLRHMLDIGDFNDRRQHGLQRWLDAILKNVKIPLVREFLIDDGQEVCPDALHSPFVEASPEAQEKVWSSLNDTTWE